METAEQFITVLDATYINTAEGGPAEWIGLWYSDGRKARLLLFPLDRTEILCAEQGDKGTLSRNGERWEFTPRGH